MNRQFGMAECQTYRKVTLFVCLFPVVLSLDVSGLFLGTVGLSVSVPAICRVSCPLPALN